MLLRKSPMTPARLQANRRNAQKSTSPRTARGKSQSRMNGLRRGSRSRLYNDLLLALSNAPPGAIAKTARAALTPAQVAHPLFRHLVEKFRQSESEVGLHFRRLFPPEDG
jgi:hypothetical protein